MRYERTIAVICGGCDLRLRIEDGATITRDTWNRQMRQMDRTREQAGESGQPIPVHSAMLFALDAGWSMLMPREIDGSFRTVTAVAPNDGVEARHATAVCPACAGHVLPPYSRAAQRVIDEAAAQERTLTDRVARLESQIAALTGMADAVTPSLDSRLTSSRMPA